VVFNDARSGHSVVKAFSERLLAPFKILSMEINIFMAYKFNSGRQTAAGYATDYLYSILK
jgi:hypothetical protein